MKTKKPADSKQEKPNEVTVIQLVPPVLFIRKKKRDFPLRVVAKLMRHIFPGKATKKLAQNGLYQQSKKVYTK